jgi:methyl-accepting chemotaxis protein
MLKRFNLKESILLCYSIPLLMIVVVALMVYGKIEVSRQMSARVEDAHEIMDSLDHFHLDLAEAERTALVYVLGGGSSEQAAAEREMREMQRGAAALRHAAAKDPAISPLLMRASDLSDRWGVVAREAIAAAGRGEKGKALRMLREAGGVKKSDDEAVTDADRRLAAAIASMQKRENDALETLVRVQVSGVAAAIVAAIAIGIWLAGRISRSIYDAVAAAASTSTEIAATVSQHERNAGQQAVMVNETSTTLEELAVSSQQASEQAAAAADLARTASSLTGEGGESMREAIEAMEGLRTRMATVAAQILSLSEQTGQVGSIAELVKDLSAQINMLALNAAVEAARAGEHGRGFAVVAAEIRKLSVESRKSAEQARSVVAGIQKATDATIMKTEEGTANIENVASIGARVSELFVSISEVAEQVYHNAQQVLLNSRQQSTAIGQIAEAANSINVGSRETAAGLAQTKIALENLNLSTDRLKAIV